MRKQQLASGGATSLKKAKPPAGLKWVVLRAFMPVGEGETKQEGERREERTKTCELVVVVVLIVEVVVGLIVCVGVFVLCLNVL